MILFAPLCIIYLYSPQKSHQLPPDGSFTLLVEPISEQFHQKQYDHNRNQYRCQERQHRKYCTEDQYYHQDSENHPHPGRQLR